MAAALFLACKIEDCYRPLKLIWKSLLEAFTTIQCRVPASVIFTLFGARDYTNIELIEADCFKIVSAEIEFLNSLNWDLHIDLPFRHFENMRNCFSELIQENRLIIEDRFNSVLRDLCLLLKNQRYLDFSSEVCAAVGISHSFENIKLPAEVSVWIERVASNNCEAFVSALDLLRQQAPLYAPIATK
jgi:hypothetical protein